MEPKLPSSFHTVILGTGLVESLVSASLARIGKSVLHLDRRNQYGGPCGSYSLNDMAELLQDQLKHSYDYSICDGSARVPAAQLPFISNIVSSKEFVTEDPSGLFFPLALSRKFCLDVCPKLIWSNSPVVQTIIRSGVSRYLEFKCFHKCTMYLGAEAQEVPCSKAGIFKNKSIGLKDKRILMKFFTSVAQPTPEDTQKHAEKGEEPFLLFLKEYGLSDTVIKYILYAIVAESSDQEKESGLSTKDGLAKLKQFFVSIGRYGATPFLVPLYGSGELPQAFCRLAAVYGATYVLGRTIQELVVEPVFEENSTICKAVITEGETIDCEHVVGAWDHLPNYVGGPTVSLSRAIVVTASPVVPANPDSDAELVVLQVPPNTFGNTRTVNVQQLSEAVNVTGNGFYVLHFTTFSVEEQAQQDLELTVKGLCNLEDPAVAWYCYFNLNNPTPSVNVPKNVHIVAEDVNSASALTYDDAVKRAEEIFQRVCPGEEFIPKVPHPEDIIYDVGQAEEAKTEEAAITNQEDGQHETNEDNINNDNTPADAEEKEKIVSGADTNQETSTA